MVSGGDTGTGVRTPPRAIRWHSRPPSATAGVRARSRPLGPVPARTWPNPP